MTFAIIVVIKIVMEDSRYSRQILLEEIELEGQHKLERSSVLVIGAGGLGSPAALYLAAAGVGTIGIMDDDRVSLSNLNRQILHATSNIGRRKTESARSRIAELNPEVKVITHDERLTAGNALEVVKDYDFVLDCTDQYQNKYLICDTCVLAHKAYCFGSVLRWGGQLMTYVPGNACYRCVFPEPPGEGEYVETCADAGIVGAVAGMVGSAQAVEAIKYLTKNHKGLLTNRLLSLDTLKMQFTIIEVEKDENCPLCSEKRSIHEPKDLPPSTCKTRND